MSKKGNFIIRIIIMYLQKVSVVPPNQNGLVKFAMCLSVYSLPS